MKQCPKCKVEKPLTEYNKNKSRKDGVQRICAVCSREEYRKHYHKGNNKQKVIELNKANRKRNRDFSIRYRKMFGKCVDCGITDYRVLQYDHVTDNKVNDVGYMTNHGYGLETIKEEIRKCEFRCANCHQIKTHYS